MSRGFDQYTGSSARGRRPATSLFGSITHRQTWFATINAPSTYEKGTGSFTVTWTVNRVRTGSGSTPVTEQFTLVHNLIQDIDTRTATLGPGDSETFTTTFSESQMDAMNENEHTLTVVDPSNSSYGETQFTVQPASNGGNGGNGGTTDPFDPNNVTLASCSTGTGDLAAGDTLSANFTLDNANDQSAVVTVALSIGGLGVHTADYTVGANQQSSEGISGVITNQVADALGGSSHDVDVTITSASEA